MDVGLTFYCLHFRALSLQELYDMMYLRQEVFVVEQDCPYIDADGKDLMGYHLMGYGPQGHLRACARLLPAGVSYPAHASIGRVVTSPALRGKGAGKALMRQSLQWCTRLFGESPLKISAQCYLIRFYESFGFQTVGEEYLEDDIPHIAMVKQ